MIKKIGWEIASLFGKPKYLPDQIEFVKPLREIRANPGDIYKYEDGYWWGPSDKVIMAHAVKRLMARSVVRGVKNGSKNNTGHNNCHRFNLVSL